MGSGRAGGRCRRVVTRFRPMARTERRGGSSMPFQPGLCAVITLPEIVLITASPKHAQAHVPSGLFRSSSFRLSGCIASAPTRRAIKMTTTTDRVPYAESSSCTFATVEARTVPRIYYPCHQRRSRSEPVREHRLFCFLGLHPQNDPRISRPRASVAFVRGSRREVRKGV